MKYLLPLLYCISLFFIASGLTCEILVTGLANEADSPGLAITLVGLAVSAGTAWLDCKVGYSSNQLAETRQYG